ncbi:MAG: hypothetical protein KAR38_08840, partial [Calditrichia bacterium]|nr:hypothetical protein [Calditrichia bacterium]
KISLSGLSTIFSQGIQHAFEKNNPFFLQNEKILLNGKNLFDVVIIPVEGKESKLLILFSDYAAYKNLVAKMRKEIVSEPAKSVKDGINFSLSFLKKFVHDIRTPLNTIQ